MVVVLGLGWIVWQGQSGSGKKRVEWRRLHFPSLCALLCRELLLLPMPGARCQGWKGSHPSTKAAPKHQAPLRSGHGLLIFDCVHGPYSLDLTAHWPLFIGHGSRELGTLLPLVTPLFTSWQVH